MKIKLILLITIVFLSLTQGKAQEYNAGVFSGKNVEEVDVCVYGGTSSGVIAAYAVRQTGKSVVLIEPGERLGGMSSGGLGITDIGNTKAITGLARDFYRRIGQYYGESEKWTFEPKAALAVFNNYVEQGNIDVRYHTRLFSVKKKNGRIREIVLENSLRPDALTRTVIKAKMFIDCSYEGDLMAQAGVSYVIGRESNSDHKETLNGVEIGLNTSIYAQFPDGVDPYRIPGKPESGLLWGISDEALSPDGTGDKKIQAYCFRLCLTSDSANMIPVTRPEGYDSTRYELLARSLPLQWEEVVWYKHFNNNRMPNNKTDINSTGGFSSNMTGMNYEYPNGSYEVRQHIIKEHEEYTKGLLYFYGHDPRVPVDIRTEILKWGYPKDEYIENGHFSPQLYIREARRMIGEYMMTEHNCSGAATVDDGIGFAAYGMDSHCCQRVVVNGRVKNEGNVQVAVKAPYPIAYRSITPPREECKNLLVPVCMSATHIAYGSIRMEPVFMVLGESAARAAVIAIDSHTDVQSIDVTGLQKVLNITDK